MIKEAIKIHGKEAASYRMVSGIVAEVNDINERIDDIGMVEYEDVTREYDDSGSAVSDSIYHYNFNKQLQLKENATYDMTGYIPVGKGDKLLLTGNVTPTIPALVAYKNGGNGIELIDSGNPVLLGVAAYNDGRFEEPEDGYPGFPAQSGYDAVNATLTNYRYVVPEGVDYVRFAARGENHVFNHKNVRIKVLKQVSSNSNEVGDNVNFVRGYGLIAKNEAEAAFGRFNASTEITDEQTAADTTVFTVGIGSSSEDRKNGLDVREDGSIYFWYKGNYVSLQELLNTLGGGEEGEGYAADSDGSQSWSPSDRPGGAYPYNSMVGSID